MSSFASVLDTGAGSSFIRKELIPRTLLDQVKSVSERLDIRDASNRRVSILGKLRLRVRLGGRTEWVHFNVVHNLGTDVILGCDFLDRHVDAIRPRNRLVTLVDGTSVPILRGHRPSKLYQRILLEPEPATEKTVRPSSRVKVRTQIVLQPGTQTWVEVSTDISGTILMDPNARLYRNHACLASNGVAEVTADKPFKVLVANFGDHPKPLAVGQVVATANVNPTNLVESTMSHAELLGLCNDKTAMRYRKRNANARDEAVINEYLRDLRSSHMGEDEKPVTADDIDLSGVDKSYHKRIRAMLRKHESMWSGQLGEITVTEHRIELKPDARPHKAQPRRSGLKERELTDFEINKQLEANVIEPTSSEWAAPVLFVPKKDGKLRFCIDYRKLNEATVKDSYPIPRMDDCLDSLGEATIFTGLDAYSGYWQMNVAKKDRHKTAFTCHAGTFQCVRMPFGLTNAPATFQRGLDMVLSKYKWKTCLVYLDDVIIYSKTVKDHINHVDEVLTCLREAGITLKISKCSFFSDKIEYLGHVIKPGRLEVDEANTKSLRDALPPTTKTQLRSFLGLVNVYRRFIKNFPEVAAPLNALLKKGAPDKFELDDAQLESFRALISAVVSPKVLALPVQGLKYSVDTDASDYGVGCALFQTHPDGTRKPIGFSSRTLNDAERNYGIPERECLAVMFALKTLRPYILYEKFILHTDQESLSWLLNIQDPSGRLLRWRLRLAEYDFEIKYKLGNLNTQADAMSRLRTSSEAAHEDMEDVPCFLATRAEEEATTPLCLLNEVEPSTDSQELDDVAADLCDIRADEVFATLPPPVPGDPAFTPITHEELVTAQLSDPFCQEIRQKLNTGEVRAFGFNDDGLLCRQVSHDQIIVPHVLKARVLHIHHYSRLAGHPGGRRLYCNLKRHMYWPAMAVDCYAVVRKCSTCAKNRIKLRQRTNPLQLFPPAGPLESVAIDIFGPLLKTPRGNEYLLMLTDRYSKLTKSVPMKSISAEAVAKAFTAEWALTYGPPKDLLSDNGSAFNSKFFASVCTILNVRNKFTTTYHPQTNGQVERYNRTLKSMLKSYLDDHPVDWDLYARTLTFAYNCQPHTSTAVAPFELILSRPPPPLAIPGSPTHPQRPIQFRDRWRAALAKVLKTSGDVMRATAARMKRNYDERLRVSREKIRPGDYVFLRVERRDENETRHKLAPVADGPFRVGSVRGNTAVIEYPDAKVERVSKDRITLAPKSLEPEEIAKVLGPITDEELVPSNYPIPQDVNLRDVLTPRNDSRGQQNSPGPKSPTERRVDAAPGVDRPVDLPGRPDAGHVDREISTAPRSVEPTLNNLEEPQESQNSGSPTRHDAATADAVIDPTSASSPEPCHNDKSTDRSVRSPHSLAREPVPATPDSSDDVADSLVTPAVNTDQEFTTAQTREQRSKAPLSTDINEESPPVPTFPLRASATASSSPPTQHSNELTPFEPFPPASSTRVPGTTGSSHERTVRFTLPPPASRPSNPTSGKRLPTKPTAVAGDLHDSAWTRTNPSDNTRARPNRQRTLPAKLRDGTNASTQSPPNTPPQRKGGGSPSLAGGDTSGTSTPANEEPYASYAGEYALDRIVGHGVNDDPYHPSADLNESMFRVRWTGYGSKDDTFEPIHHVPRTAVVSYCKRKGLDLPQDLGRAQVG